MDKDILSVIEAASPGFSKGQRSIAKYILENYEKAAFMTASRLGQVVDVSESTVVRLRPNSVMTDTRRCAERCRI